MQTNENVNYFMHSQQPVNSLPYARCAPDPQAPMVQGMMEPMNKGVSLGFPPGTIDPLSGRMQLDQRTVPDRRGGVKVEREDTVRGQNQSNPNIQISNPPKVAKIKQAIQNTPTVTQKNIPQYGAQNTQTQFSEQLDTSYSTDSVKQIPRKGSKGTKPNAKKTHQAPPQKPLFLVDERVKLLHTETQSNRRFGFSASGLKQKVIVVGGCPSDQQKSYDECTRSISILKVLCNKWEAAYPYIEGDNFPKGRIFHSTVIYKSRLFLFGGADSVGTSLNDFWTLKVDYTDDCRKHHTENEPFRWHRLSFDDDIPPNHQSNDSNPTELTTAENIAKTKEAEAISTSVSAPTTPPPRAGHGCCLCGSKMFIYGGAKTQFVPSTDNGTTIVSASELEVDRYRTDLWVINLDPICTVLDAIESKSSWNDAAACETEQLRKAVVWQHINLSNHYESAHLFKNGALVALNFSPQAALQDDSSHLLVYNGGIATSIIVHQTEAGLNAEIAPEKAFSTSNDPFELVVVPSSNDAEWRGKETHCIPILTANASTARRRFHCIELKSGVPTLTPLSEHAVWDDELLSRSAENAVAVKLCLPKHSSRKTKKKNEQTKVAQMKIIILFADNSIKKKHIFDNSIKMFCPYGIKYDDEDKDDSSEIAKKAKIQHCYAIANL